jgi:uncharacterized protein YutE (UPF0331/DUF86 family)
MTSTEQINFKRLETSIDKCETHLKRIQYASNQVKNLFPLSIEKYSNISEATIGNIDQLVFRFSKLQDELGNNTFRFLLEYLQEDIVGKPFRDILNILERLRIIDSSETWLSLRELRNDLAHEYPVLIGDTINKLNYLFSQVPVLENILETVKSQLKR